MYRTKKTKILKLSAIVYIMHTSRQEGMRTASTFMLGCFNGESIYGLNDLNPIKFLINVNSRLIELESRLIRSYLRNNNAHERLDN